MKPAAFRAATEADLRANVLLIADDGLGRGREDVAEPLNPRYAAAFQAMEECCRRGCSLVQLTSDKVRTDAHAFYEQLGFKASHEGFKLILD